MADTRTGRQALVIVNTGDGKGKTTAALGVMMRAWGRGWQVLLCQFIKASTANFGEQRAARKMAIEQISLGAGFTWNSSDIEHDKALARDCWEQSKARLLSGDYDLVVFDEITYPITFGWLSLDEVLETLRRRPSYTHVILTGRDAPPELVDYADLVTEMRVVKHPFEKGIKAQAGIEF